MSNKVTIGLAFIIVITNLILGHFFGPFGIMATPILLPIVSIIISFGLINTRPFSKALLLYGLIGLNDIGLKLYAGGTHDQAGLGWMMMMTLIGLVPSICIFIISPIFEKKINGLEHFLSIVLFISLLVLHLFLFEKVGLGRSY